MLISYKHFPDEPLPYEDVGKKEKILRENLYIIIVNKCHTAVIFSARSIMVQLFQSI